jgi:hypothetical protein
MVCLIFGCISASVNIEKVESSAHDARLTLADLSSWWLLLNVKSVEAFDFCDIEI